MAKGAAALRNKELVKERNAQTAVLRAAARGEKYARVASEINLLASSVDQARTVQQLQAALATLNGLRSGWCILVRDLSTEQLPPAAAERGRPARGVPRARARAAAENHGCRALLTSSFGKCIA